MYRFVFICLTLLFFWACASEQPDVIQQEETEDPIETETETESAASTIEPIRNDIYISSPVSLSV